MAMTFGYRVLENAARNYILQVNGVDVATTTAATAYSAQTGIIAANGYSGVTNHLKIERILYSTYNAIARVQWHQTTNTDAAILSGYGDYTMHEQWGRAAFINNDQGTGSTGDIDLAVSAAATVTTGGGVTASISLVIFAIKGV